MMKGQNSFSEKGLSTQYSIFNDLAEIENRFVPNSLVKDWILRSSLVNESGASFLNLIEVSKKIKNNLITIRYTPGKIKEFSFLQNQTFISGDTSSISFQTGITYREVFGIRYDYKFLNWLSAGISSRYFSQNIKEENISAVFSDTLFLSRLSEEQNKKNWKNDLFISINPLENLSLSIATSNLYVIRDGASSNYDLNFPQRLLLSFDYLPFRNVSLSGVIESNYAFLLGFNSWKNFEIGSFGIGSNYFSSEDADVNVNGLIASIKYQYGDLGFSISAIKYFTKPIESESHSQFVKNRISSITNNRFSSDKLYAEIYFALNSKPEQKVKILSVERIEKIFPIISEEYASMPFAEIRVVNLTGDFVNVKPSSQINVINKERIYSPSVSISPNDTVVIPFYSNIDTDYSTKKTELSFVNFYISSDNSSIDDEIQKPILINGINAWSGNVNHLKYFVTKDFSYSSEFTKKILLENKSHLSSVDERVLTFEKIKLIFNKVFPQMLYVSDPNATYDYVQFPKETIQLRGGDCDDFAVCFSSLLESIGIETAFVDYSEEQKNSHVNILVNTELSTEEAYLITGNDLKYIIRKNSAGEDQIWIPIETTVLTDFYDAWNVGVEKFNTEAIQGLGLSKGKVHIIDVY